MQSWAMEPCRTVQNVESPSQTLVVNRTTRPDSMIISSPSTNQSPAVYSIKQPSEVYSSDTLRRNNQSESTKPNANHLLSSCVAPSAVVTDDTDTLNRKSSSKSTSSKSKDDAGHNSRRTDHDRDREFHKSRLREREVSNRDRETNSGGAEGLTKRKGPCNRSRPEDSLEIYESLSESPV